MDDFAKPIWISKNFNFSAAALISDRPEIFSATYVMQLTYFYNKDFY
jgi:hypothetical protein